MLYKLLKREDQGLYLRKCFINILKLYYTAGQNPVFVYASTLTFTCLIKFWQSPKVNKTVQLMSPVVIENIMNRIDFLICPNK